MARIPKVVLDTNVIVSALVYGGKPEQIIRLVLSKEIEAVTSPTLLAELSEVLAKKFNFDQAKIEQTQKKIKEGFRLIQPRKVLTIVKDEPDNRVLEAADAAACDSIVTGDKELLELHAFKDIKIITPAEFLTLRPK